MAAPFLTPDGQPYLEVHHLRRLSDGDLIIPGGSSPFVPIVTDEHITLKMR